MRALLLHKEPVFNASVADIAAPDLSAGEVRVGVDYSTLNYKDGLAITNAAPVVRLWPMVAGIDGSGTVLESQHPDWKAGDAFVLNGWGVGETHWGCLAEQACLKGDWLVPLRRELGLPHFSDATHFIEYEPAELDAELRAVGFEPVELVVVWGELWATAVAAPVLPAAP
jgi:NADPH:quinone reductase-like Zn-dependent oxidoreductase